MCFYSGINCGILFFLVIKRWQQITTLELSQHITLLIPQEKLLLDRLATVRNLDCVGKPVDNNGKFYLIESSTLNYFKRLPN